MICFWARNVFMRRGSLICAFDLGDHGPLARLILSRDQDHMSCLLTSSLSQLEASIDNPNFFNGLVLNIPILDSPA